ncbi:MAG: PilT protein domain protein [Segetibacter sp.]|jgi:predicted nucleic acid-binding protein|nr:PilT protein domain protein [Segetibacter sp.]
MDVFVLDACGLIAYLRNEEGWEKIIKLFDTAIDLEAKVLMHAANLSEVYYDFWRVSDKITADKMISDLSKVPIELINTISIQMIQTIGYFKTTYKISFADSFVLSTAKLNNAKVVTSDHHEFDEIEKNGDITVEWIR